MTKMDKGWGVTILAFLLNLASVIWACYLVNKTISAYNKYYDVSYFDADADIYGNQITTNIIASSILAAGILNIIGSAFVFHGLHKENMCSLIWYIVLNSVAVSTQIVVVTVGVILGTSHYSNTYHYYGNNSGSETTIPASGMNQTSLCYFTLVVIVFNLASTVIIKKLRNETRNKKIAARFVVSSPQVVMVPGASTTVFTQHTTGQYQNQYPQPFPTQQYYMPQQFQQQGNPPPYAPSAPGPSQYYGISNTVYVDT